MTTSTASPAAAPTQRLTPPPAVTAITVGGVLGALGAATYLASFAGLAGLSGREAVPHPLPITANGGDWGEWHPAPSSAASDGPCAGRTDGDDSRGKGQPGADGGHDQPGGGHDRPDSGNGRRDRRVPRLSRLVAVGAVVLVALAACSSDGSAGVAAGRQSVSQQPFTQATVDAFVADLAEAGIPVYPTGSTTPLVPVRAPGPLALSQDQAASAALGAWGHSGLTGSAVDSLAQLAPLADGAQPIPASLFVEAWSQVAPGPAAALAKKILGDQDWSHYDQVVLPAAVLALFASAAVATTGGDGGGGQANTPTRGATAGGAVGTTAGAGTRAQPIALAEAAATRGPVAAPAGTSVCEQFQGFVPNTIEKVFTAIGHIELVDFNGNVLHDIFAFIRNRVADVGNLALDTVHFIVVNGVQLAVGPVLNGIAAVASVLAVASNIVLVLQPWTSATQPDPRILTRDTSTHPGTLTLTMRGVTGANDWPTEISGCARASGVDLPSLQPRDGDLTWTIVAQDPMPMITKIREDGKLHTDGTATMGYETIPEPPEIQDGEVLYNGSATVDTAVHRKDLDQLEDLVKGQIYRFVPAAVDQVFGGAIRDLVDPQIHRLLAPLTTLRDMTVRSTLRLNYHDPETSTRKPGTPGAPPKAKPLQIPNQCPSQDAVTAAVGQPVTFDGLPGSILHAGPHTLCGYDAGAGVVQIGFGPNNGPLDLSQETGKPQKVDIPGTDVAYLFTYPDTHKVELTAGGQWFGLGAPPNVDVVAATKRLLGVG
ncbi:hypothetical protein [Frankia sp. Cas3]|uniref:hypothetical protein n=1 Tax=Frankia sp. Cas3 TaxID=3073926 RepID=UPI002AD51CAE|nr:hypothetical protein [Frankia sp. Cas3]